MNLTTKEKLQELHEFYTFEKLAELLNTTRQTLANAASETTKPQIGLVEKIDSFFDLHVKKHSSFHKLSELIVENKETGQFFLVDTPDGFQTVNKFFIKAPAEIVKIKTQNHSLRCSVGHLVWTPDENRFTLASDLNAGINVNTRDGVEAIVSLTQQPAEVVYDFEVAHVNHRYYAGSGIESHNSGKSFLLCNILREAQKEGAFLFVLDSENALDPTFMSKIGVKVGEDDMLYAQVVTIQDITSAISEFVKGYEKAYKDIPIEQRPEIVICIDSLDMLLTDGEQEKFEKGVQTGDQGQRAKLIKHLLRTVTTKISRHPMTLIATHQVYPADPMAGDGVWALTNGVKYCASQIALITKLKLKEDGEVTGIRMRVETYKSRFAQLGKKVEVSVPYNKGMDPLSGLLEHFVEEGYVIQSGAWYSTNIPGQPAKKFQSKQFDMDFALSILNTHPTILKSEGLMEAVNEEIEPELLEIASTVSDEAVENIEIVEQLTEVVDQIIETLTD